MCVVITEMPLREFEVVAAVVVPEPFSPLIPVQLACVSGTLDCPPPAEEDRAYTSRVPPGVNTQGYWWSSPLLGHAQRISSFFHRSAPLEALGLPREIGRAHV